MNLQHTTILWKEVQKKTLWMNVGGGSTVQRGPVIGMALALGTRARRRLRGRVSKIHRLKQGIQLRRKFLDVTRLAGFNVLRPHAHQFAQQA